MFSEPFGNEYWHNVEADSVHTTLVLLSQPTMCRLKCPHKWASYFGLTQELLGPRWFGNDFVSLDGPRCFWCENSPEPKNWFSCERPQVCFTDSVNEEADYPSALSQGLSTIGGFLLPLVLSNTTLQCSTFFSFPTQSNPTWLFRNITL